MIEVIGEPETILAEWTALWRRSGATAFQSPAWLLAWWRQFGTGQARVAVLRGSEGLLGVLAVYALPEEEKLLLMGAGLTDLQDVLLAPDAPQAAAAGLLSAAVEGSRLALHAADLPPGAALRGAAVPMGWRALLTEIEPCAVVTTSARLPQGQRRKLALARNRAERAGGWCLEESPDALEAVLALHVARWGDGGVLADARVGAFLRDAVTALIAERAARVFVLRLGGAVAAGCVALTAPGRLLLYLQGRDSARDFESPGTLLLGAVLERAAAEGLREVDLLRGTEAYKRRWGAVDRWNALRVLTPPMGAAS